MIWACEILLAPFPCLGIAPGEGSWCLCCINSSWLTASFIRLIDPFCYCLSSLLQCTPDDGESPKPRAVSGTEEALINVGWKNKECNKQEKYVSKSEPNACRD